MSEAIFSKEDIVEVSGDTVNNLKDQAKKASDRRFRLCLHKSVDDELHQSVIVFCQEAYNRPHRHPVGKAESYHIIEGEMTVLFFDDEGQVIKTIKMGERESGKTFFYRLGTNEWHMPVPESEFVVFHETNLGPYQKDIASEYAPWSPPAEDTARIDAFLKKIKDKS